MSSNLLSSTVTFIVIFSSCSRVVLISCTKSTRNQMHTASNPFVSQFPAISNPCFVSCVIIHLKKLCPDRLPGLITPGTGNALVVYASRSSFYEPLVLSPSPCPSRYIHREGCLF